MAIKKGENKGGNHLIPHSSGLHHYHMRKRLRLHHEPFPHPNPVKRFMDTAIYFAGIFGPLMTLPQLFNIWVLKNAEGVSILSWIGLLCGALFWLVYAILHKEKPLILTYSSWIFFEIMIIIGILIYG